MDLWVGKNMSDLGIRKKYKVNIIAIKNENILDPMPSPNYVFRENDHIIVIGKSSDVFKLTSLT